MTPLRQRMTEDMQLRGLALATQQAYLRYVEQLAVFTGRSPDLATDEDFRQFFLALHKQHGCSRSTATVAIAAFKFLFEHTHSRPGARSLARCNAGQRLSAQMNGFLQQRSAASSAG